MTATATASKKARTAKKATSKSTSTPARRTGFKVSDLPTEGKEYRKNGDYKSHLSALRKFASTDELKGAVAALTHLGWVKAGGDNNASKSSAFQAASNAGLPDEQFSVGEPAGPQIVANLAALKEAGAPQEALDGLWAAYTGSGSPAPADDDLV